MSRATPPVDPRSAPSSPTGSPQAPSSPPDRDPRPSATDMEAAADAPEEDDSPSNRCAKCGAEFSGEGARKAYREHMTSFHPAAK